MTELFLKLQKDKFEQALKTSDLKTSIKLSLPSWSGTNLNLLEDNDKSEYYIHLCGKITDKTVLDFDSDESFYKYKNLLAQKKLYLDDIPIYKTKKGFQIFYRYIPGLKTSVRKNIDIPVDVRNDNSLSFAHPSLFSFGYYSDYNNVPLKDRRRITPEELNVFMDMLESDLDVKETKDASDETKTVKVKTSKGFEELVTNSVNTKKINPEDLLKELQLTRPFEFNRIPTKPGEGRNNFLTIFRGKVLRHTRINAKTGAEFLELINTQFLNLPKGEMKNFSEKALLKSPLYIDPKQYETELNLTYNFDKKFYGQNIYGEASKTWCEVIIKSDSDIQVNFFANKENFISCIKRDKDYRTYYLDDKNKLIMDNLTIIKIIHDYNIRKAIWKDEETDRIIINQPSLEHTDYYINYDKYCYNSSNYIPPTSFITLTKNLIPEERVRLHFLGALHYFLKTGNTCQTYPIFVDSCGGTGKTLITSLINAIIYKGNRTNEISSYNLTNIRFNGPYVSSKLLVINESGDILTKNQARKVSEQLKLVVGNSSIQAEFKGRDVVSIDAPRFVIQTTNNYEDIFIDSNNDRRQYVIHTSEKRLDKVVANTTLFNNMSDFIDDLYSRIPDIIAYMEDISRDFTVEDYITAPETQATKELKADSETEVLSDIKSIFKQGGEIDYGALADMKLEEGDTNKRILIDFIEADILKNGLIRERVLAKILREAYYNCGRMCIHQVFRYLRQTQRCINPTANRHKIFEIKIKKE